MRSVLLFLALCGVARAQPDAAPPALIDLHQAAPHPHDRLRLPKGHSVGPVIPGLTQGAIPQGLAFWESQQWFLISCYFPHEQNRPSVVVAVDARTGKVVRSLTLLEASGKAHMRHVGGLAVSDKYLWVGSGSLYRAPLADVLAAKPVAYLRLEKPFRAETDASFISYHDRRVWVGEFVNIKDDKFKGKPAHYLKDREGHSKHAWVCGYALDADDNLPASAAPAAILSVRDNVQGLAFHHGHIILSTSYGKTKDSHLAVYKNPFSAEAKKPHSLVKVGSAVVPCWFLDAKDHLGKDIDFPPMSEGITAYGNRLAVICESGAEKYKAKGHAPLDHIIFLNSPGK